MHQGARKPQAILESSSRPCYPEVPLDWYLCWLSLLDCTGQSYHFIKRTGTDGCSHENVEVLPGENIEDDEDDSQCTKRVHKSDLSQNHASKAARIESHNANDAMQSDGTVPLSLFHLHSNIHHAIFSYLEDVEHVLSLSLTSRYFWAVGVMYIEDHIVKSLAPWAGERIICASDRCDPRDYPPGLLSPEEEAEVRELNRVYDMESFSIDHTYKKVGGPSLSQKLQRWFQKYEAEHPMSAADRTEIMMGLKPEILEFYPHDQQWILRNLTTKEYVRGEVIALKEEFIHGPQIDVFGFAEILIPRISWSSEPVRIGRCPNISHGKWAGHRFDITPFAFHAQQVQDGGWRDVSDEVFREADLIIGGEQGDDWRDQLARSYRKATAQSLMSFS